MDFIKEFFRITENIKGKFLGPAHIVVALICSILLVFLGIYFGFKLRDKPTKQKKFILISAIIVWIMELFHLIWYGYKYGGMGFVLGALPINLCDIQFFVLIPICFSKNKQLKEACMGFVICLGILAAVMGLWTNGSLYNQNPIWSCRVIYTCCVHSIPGMLAIFIPVSHMYKLQLKSVWRTLLIMLPFEIIAMSIDYGLNTNYMFFINPNGTPFSIFWNFCKGNIHLYSFIVLLSFNAYVILFYVCWHYIDKIIMSKKSMKKSV